MEKSLNLEEFKPYLWRDWYLSIENKDFGFILPVIQGDTCYNCFTDNKHCWDVHITMDSFNNKKYMTSQVIHFDEPTMRVWTLGGGIYKLGVPLNGIQKYYLSKYFEEN